MSKRRIEPCHGRTDNTGIRETYLISGPFPVILRVDREQRELMHILQDHVLLPMMRDDPDIRHEEMLPLKLGPAVREGISIPGRS